MAAARRSGKPKGAKSDTLGQEESHWAEAHSIDHPDPEKWRALRVIRTRLTEKEGGKHSPLGFLSLRRRSKVAHDALSELADTVSGQEMLIQWLPPLPERENYGKRRDAQFWMALEELVGDEETVSDAVVDLEARLAAVFGEDNAGEEKKNLDAEEFSEEGDTYPETRVTRDEFHDGISVDRVYELLLDFAARGLRARRRREIAASAAVPKKEEEDPDNNNTSGGGDGKGEAGDGSSDFDRDQYLTGFAARERKRFTGQQNYFIRSLLERETHMSFSGRRRNEMLDALIVCLVQKESDRLEEAERKMQQRQEEERRRRERQAKEAEQKAAWDSQLEHVRFLCDVPVPSGPVATLVLDGGETVLVASAVQSKFRVSIVEGIDLGASAQERPPEKPLSFEGLRDRAIMGLAMCRTEHNTYIFVSSEDRMVDVYTIDFSRREFGNRRVVVDLHGGRERPSCMAVSSDGRALVVGLVTGDYIEVELDLDGTQGGKVRRLYVGHGDRPMDPDSNDVDDDIDAGGQRDLTQNPTVTIGEDEFAGHPISLGTGMICVPFFCFWGFSVIFCCGCASRSC
jgi:hypothetical protein